MPDRYLKKISKVELDNNLIQSENVKNVSKLDQNHDELQQTFSDNY